MNDQTSARFAVPMPAKIRNLPRDDRGYPVPWFVDWQDGNPVFPAFSPNKFERAVRIGVCWVCGQHLGRYKTFTVGPMCTINQISAEPPSHRECAIYSAKVCPFLSNPDMRRVPVAKYADGHVVGPSGGVMVETNPGIIALWTCLNYKVVQVSNGAIIRMGAPEAVQWFMRGRPATIEETTAAFDQGCERLRSLAMERDGLQAMPHLDKLIETARIVALP